MFFMSDINLRVPVKWKEPIFRDPDLARAFVIFDGDKSSHPTQIYSFCVDFKEDTQQILQAVIYRSEEPETYRWISPDHTDSEYEEYRNVDELSTSWTLSRGQNSKVEFVYIAVEEFADFLDIANAVMLDQPIVFQEKLSYDLFMATYFPRGVSELPMAPKVG